jgi:hypothetical protein
LAKGIELVPDSVGSAVVESIIPMLVKGAVMMMMMIYR